MSSVRIEECGTFVATFRAGAWRGATIITYTVRILKAGDLWLHLRAWRLSSRFLLRFCAVRTEKLGHGIRARGP